MRRNALLLVISVALGSGTVACGPSQEDYDAALERNRQLQADLEQEHTQRQELEQHALELSAQNEELANRLRALGENVEELQSTNSTLQTNLTETQRALDELRARERQAQERLATFRQLMERFRAMIDSGRLRVRIVRNRMVVDLPSGVLFDSARAELKPEGLSTLAEVATVLRDIANREFQVAGHTDNVPISGRFHDNWDLSTARAVTVTQYLVSRGVPANRLSAAGYADTQPVASNDTAEGRQQNRRIEIALMPNLDELPDLSSLTEPATTPSTPSNSAPSAE
jgi:chemotaxis protein MotB